MKFKKFLVALALIGVVSSSPLTINADYGTQINADITVPTSFNVSDAISEDFVQKVAESYLQIPESIRLSFESSGGSVQLTEEDLGIRFYGKNNTVLALYTPETNTVYIDYREKAIKSVQHEFGHYVDYSHNWISQTDEFKRIHNAEVASFCKIHKTAKQNTNTPIEYFAESFQFYINNPQTLLASCPQTYAFIDAIVKGGI